MKLVYPEKKRLGTKDAIFAKLEEKPTTLKTIKADIQSGKIDSRTYLLAVINGTMEGANFLKDDGKPYKMNAKQLEEFIEKHKINLPTRGSKLDDTPF